MDKIAFKLLLIVSLVIIDAESKKRQQFDDEAAQEPKLSDALKGKRIIDGVPARNGEFPFIVSIIHKDKHFCGGAIIAPDFILTAGHCFDEEDDGGEVLPKNLQVSTGNIYWRKGIMHRVDKIIRHEKYNPVKVINDIALLKLRKQIKFNDNSQMIKPNPHALPDEKVTTRALVIGWGYYSVKKRLVSKAHDTLMSVEIFTIPWYMCQNHYTDISDKQLCMTNIDGKGSCNGDSGGPLVAPTDLGLMQVGIVSYGADCNNTQPEVYTRVSAFYPWIRKQTTMGKSQRSSRDE